MTMDPDRLNVLLGVVYDPVADRWSIDGRDLTAEEIAMWHSTTDEERQAAAAIRSVGLHAKWDAERAMEDEVRERENHSQ